MNKIKIVEDILSRKNMNCIERFHFNNNKQICIHININIAKEVGWLNKTMVYLEETKPVILPNPNNLSEDDTFDFGTGYNQATFDSIIEILNLDSKNV